MSLNVDYGLVKKPQHERPLTEEEKEEWLKCANDIEYFLSNYVYIQNPRAGAVKFKPRPYQKRILREIYDNPFVVGCLSRQSGKTTIVGPGYLLHEAIFNEDMGIGVASNNLGNAKDIMDRVRFAYEHLPDFLKPAVTEYAKHRITFNTGSYIEGRAITESTFRGRSLSRIFIDELAHTRGGDEVAKEFWTALLPSISGGLEESDDGPSDRGDTRIIIMSTPNGTSDLFSELVFGAQNGENGFKYVTMRWDEVPGRDEKWKEDMLKKMSEDQFNQEFMMAFISTSGTLVDSATLESMKTKSEPLRMIEGMYVYVDSFKDRNLSISLDPSEGVGKDSHAIQIIDLESFEQIGEFKNNKMSQSIMTSTLISILKKLKQEGCGDIYLSVENNGLGIGILNLLNNSEDDILEEIFIIRDKKRQGIQMTNPIKKRGCARLKDLLETGRLKINSPRLLSELKFFIKRGESFKAERGKHDDLVMSMVINMIMMDRISKMDEGVWDTINNVDIEKGEGEDAEPLGIVF